MGYASWMLRGSVAVTLIGVAGNVFAGGTVPDISGVWTRAATDASQAAVRPPLKPKYLKVYEAARKARAQAGSRPSGEIEKCWVEGMPTVMAARGPLEILQTPGQVTVLAEYMSQTRRIAMDEKPPAAADVNPGYMGLSVGRWNGATLEVETVGVREDVRYEGIPHSGKMKIVEKIRLLGPDQLQDELTLQDPDTLLQPYRLTFQYKRDPQHKVMEYACKHPGATAAAKQAK
jgi:hypothetical protein